MRCATHAHDAHEEEAKDGSHCQSKVVVCKGRIRPRGRPRPEPGLRVAGSARLIFLSMSTFDHQDIALVTHDRMALITRY